MNYLSVSPPLLFLIILGLSIGCRNDKPSARELRRDQIRIDSENKRHELSKITGTYDGQLLQEHINTRSVTLKFSTHEVPQIEEGEIDPIAVPVLGGYLQFPYGSNADSYREIISFAVKESDFDAKTGRLSLFVENSQFGKINLELKINDTGFSGTWSSPGVSRSGTTTMMRRATTDLLPTSPPSPIIEGPSLSGEYSGILTRQGVQEKNLITLNLTASAVTPDKIDFTAIARLYVSEMKSNEFITYNFNSVEFHPVSGILTIKDPQNSEIAFTGEISQGAYQVIWSSKTDGIVGSVPMRKVK